MGDEQRVVSASLVVDAPADAIWALIVEPTAQPSWDGNENLGHAEPGQQVHGVGDVFRMTLTGGAVRDNHVVEYDEGRLVAWRPSDRDDAWTSDNGGRATGNAVALQDGSTMT